jgi:hypothetical protein
MPTINRKLQVTFSKAEIQAILAERARALVLTRKDVKRIELEQVAHVEGEAIVTMVIDGHPRLHCWLRQADLQFGATSVAQLSQRSQGILQPSMKVVPASKSASIRIVVPIVDFSRAPEAQHQAIVEGFAARELLRSFFVAHREQLLSIAQ